MMFTKIAAALLISVGLAAPAHADVNDDFYAAAQQAGVTGSRAQIIKTGHDICTVIGNGQTSLRMLGVLIAIDDPSAREKSPELAATAITVLCPQYLNTMTD